MKAVNIKINSKKISAKINKKQLKWVINFLQNKIKKNIYLNNKKVECILIDKNSLNIEEFKKIYFKNDVEESFSINAIQNNFKKVLIYGHDTRGLVYEIIEIDQPLQLSAVAGTNPILKTNGLILTCKSSLDNEQIYFELTNINLK